jgi:hypothetical protein
MAGGFMVENEPILRVVEQGLSRIITTRQRVGHKLQVEGVCKVLEVVLDAFDHSFITAIHLVEWTCPISIRLDVTKSLSDAHDCRPAIVAEGNSGHCYPPS